jgi:V/A-type H+-transporting ATPase subunit I
MIYFTPAAKSDTVDGATSAMGFERIMLSGELTGKPGDALKYIAGKQGELEAAMRELSEKLKEFVKSNKDELLQIYFSLVRINRNQEVRRNAIHTNNSFYICGWIPEDDLPELAEMMEKDNKGTFIDEKPELIKNLTPPTDLKNNRVFKFFEAFVKMYGLPSYNEIDPTAFVALTYFLMFGVMFGDVGQGIVIMLIGLLLMRRGFGLAGVFVCIGVSSTIFGFVYGAVFGDEEIVRGIINPMKDQSSLLIGGVVVGIIFMTIAIVMNIINGLKEKNLARILLDRNGAAGLVFYWAIVIFAVYYALSSKYLLPMAVMVVFVLAPFLVIFFKEPIERLLEKRKFLPEKKGMFFVQAFFEMLDMLLSVASNTISFIRIGAFALNHVGLFMACRVLSQMAGNVGGVFVNIFANVLIIALEGLIVGIQCLRLEYYELFSRFFKGGGKLYKPLKHS